MLVLDPPLSDDWPHEAKYDGFRTELIRDWAGVRAFTRTGIDWSKRYWPVVDAAEKLPAKSFIIDGEMIAPDPDGKPNFHQITHGWRGTQSCSPSSPSTSCISMARTFARGREASRRRHPV